MLPSNEQVADSMIGSLEKFDTRNFPKAFAFSTLDAAAENRPGVEPPRF